MNTKGQKEWEHVMKVIRTNPKGWRFWHLIEDAGKHFLMVQCEQSAVSFSFAIELNEKERAMARDLGW